MVRCPRFGFAFIDIFIGVFSEEPTAKRLPQSVALLERLREARVLKSCAQHSFITQKATVIKTVHLFSATKQNNIADGALSKRDALFYLLLLFG